MNVCISDFYISRYTFPRFSLCRAEFLELLVHVPCDTDTYIQANYGTDWDVPVTKWDWMTSPHNVQPNGVWPVEMWDEVIQMFEE